MKTEDMIYISEIHVHNYAAEKNIFFFKASIVQLGCQSCISLVRLGRGVWSSTEQRVSLTWHDFPWGHGSALTVQQALPSVFLFVHQLWADRWPSFQASNKRQKKARFPPNCGILKACRQFWRNSAVTSQHVREILKWESAWMTNNNIVSFDTRRSSVLFLSTTLCGSSVSFSLHRHCVVYIVRYSCILLLNKLLVVLKGQNMRYSDREEKKCCMHPEHRAGIILYCKVLFTNRNIVKMSLNFCLSFLFISRGTSENRVSLLFFFPF